MFIYQYGDKMAVLLLYVDDIILACSSTALCENIISYLMQIFPVKDLGTVHYFLDIESTFQNNSKQLLLTQKKYILETLQKYDLLNCKSSKPPVTKGQKLSSTTGVPLEDATLYISLVGGLQYSTYFSVNYVSQFMQSPTDEHLIFAKRILRYLKGTLGSGVLLCVGDVTSITTYSDSDWAG